MAADATPLLARGAVGASCSSWCSCWRSSWWGSAAPRLAGRRLHQHQAALRRALPFGRGAGPEDLTIDAPARRAIVSASDRRATLAGHPVPGAIWSYSLDAVDAMPVNMTPDAGLYLQPHGIVCGASRTAARRCSSSTTRRPGTAGREHTIETSTSPVMRWCTGRH
jgi:hypothetical protein